MRDGKKIEVNGIKLAGTERQRQELNDRSKNGKRLSGDSTLEVGDK